MENPRLGKERGCGRGQAQGASRGQGGRKEGLLGNCLCLVSWKENRARLEGDEERSPGRSTPSRCPPPPWEAGDPTLLGLRAQGTRPLTGHPRNGGHPLTPTQPQAARSFLEPMGPPPSTHEVVFHGSSLMSAILIVPDY